MISRTASCVAQALAEIHAAGVCLLDICEESIWITEHGSAAFLDFSMAHEFVPGSSPLTYMQLPTRLLLQNSQERGLLGLQL